MLCGARRQGRATGADRRVAGEVDEGDPAGTVTIDDYPAVTVKAT